MSRRWIVCLSLLAACGDNVEKSQLTTIVHADPSTTCPDGGSVIESGTDTNGDGMLGSDEITTTQEICNGANGSSTGGGQLVTVDGQVGSNCPLGGSRIEVGSDTNGDGVLEQSEVTETEYVCSALPGSAYYLGNVLLGSAADLAAVQQYGAIIGDVIVEPTFTGVLSWPALTVVTGELYVAPGDGDLSIDLTGLAGVDVVDVESRAGLTTISLDALASASNVGVWDSPDLTSISLAALARTTYLQIEGNDSLTALTAPSLAQVTDFYVDGNAQLSTCSVLDLFAGLVSRAAAWPSDWNYSGNDSSVACTASATCVPKTFADISGATFEFCVQPLSWPDAETFCETTFSGALATFGSDAEWSAFRTDTLGWAGQNVTWWLGYTDAAVEGTWVPPDGVTAGYEPAPDDSTFFANEIGEPNGGTSENCAQFPEDTYVNDLYCGDTEPFVCRH